MTHFSEARNGVTSAVQTNTAATSRIARGCLIWDLRGRLRFMFEPAEGEDVEDLKTQLSTIFSQAAGPYWSGEFWTFDDTISTAERAVYEKAWAESREMLGGPAEFRVLERRYSKAGWFSPPLTPPWPLLEQTQPILSFYSFKGGVGRTTALVSLAIQLSREAKHVAIIDLDLESPGISSVLHGAEGYTSELGVVDYLLEVSLLGRGTLHLEDYYYSVDNPAIIGETGVPITVVPAGRLDDTYLEKLARIDYESLYWPGEETPRAPLAELLGHLRSDLRDLDYVLLDARAGFHDLGGLALSGLSHLDVVFGLSNEQSWKGLELLVRFLGSDRVLRGEKQLTCALAYAMAPLAGDENRDLSVETFLDRSYNLFSRDYYDVEDADPEEHWPLPGIYSDDSPHYPIVLAFDPTVQNYIGIEAVADRLTQGDFGELARRLLERVGRSLHDG